MSGQFNNKICAAIALAILSFFSPFSQAQETKEHGFDFSGYDSVLKTFVNEKAMVNYGKLKAQRRQLDAFAAAMS